MRLPLSYWLDPVLFARDILAFRPDGIQARVLRASSPRVMLKCTRQWGKSTVVAALAAHWACTRTEPGLAVVLSPSIRQSAEMLRKVTGFLEAAGQRWGRDGVNRHSLELRGGSRLVALPAKENTIRGFSAPSLIVVDEAAHVPDGVYRAVRPMLAAARGARMVLLSTPRGKRGFFYDEWINSFQNWTRVEVPATECPRIDPAFLEEERHSLGDWAFRQEYLCEFVDHRSQLFSPGLLSAVISDGWDHWSFLE